MSSRLEYLARKLANNTHGGTPIQEVVSAVRELIEVVKAENLSGPDVEMYRNIAKSQFTEDLLDIDADAIVSIAEDGAWVQAWVWIEKPCEAPT